MLTYKTKRYYKIGLLIAAILIAVFSLWYSNGLVKKLADEEKKNVEQYAIAQKNILSDIGEQELIFYLKIIEENTTIPVILEGEDGKLTGKNFDSLELLKEDFLEKKKLVLQETNDPIILEISPGVNNKVYYGESKILKALRYYPYVQLGIIGVFLILSYLAFSYSRKSEQNQVWVGMSKETAHQLGTPISSLMAWLDMIEADRGEDKKVVEMKNDVKRLRTITERFSKIGSKPELIPHDINEVLGKAFDYMEKRSPSHVKFTRKFAENLPAVGLNVPLFEWVIENLCKNAIDAMKGEGAINVSSFLAGKQVVIEVKDTGHGIPKKNQKTVFKPGYTSKKRGWGLGLSLCKRIITNYHKGTIFVKESVMGKGTTFRIELAAHEANN